MAKKRVYEIAKEKGVSSKDLIAALQAAGIEVKAAASTVDEADATRALSADGAGNGKPSAPQAAAKARRGEARRGEAPPPSRGRSRRRRRPQQPKAAATRKAPRPAAAPQPAPASSAAPVAGAAAAPARRGQRPAAVSARRPAGAGGGGGGGGRRRRVVIDSQASRRQAPHPPPPQRRRRSRGRGAPPPEPSESNQTTAVAEPEAIRIPSGATVRDVAEHLGVQVSDVIKKLMQLGEMASITQTLSDEAIGVIADEFEKKVEVVQRVRGRDPGAGLRRRRGGPHRAAAGRDDHGSRRPRQDLAARRDPRDRGRGRARPAASRSTSAPTRCTTATRS